MRLRNFRMTNWRGGRPFQNQDPNSVPLASQNASSFVANLQDSRLEAVSDFERFGGERLRLTIKELSR
jgi:hypothetical protein